MCGYCGWIKSLCECDEIIINEIIAGKEEIFDDDELIELLNTG